MTAGKKAEAAPLPTTVAKAMAVRGYGGQGEPLPALVRPDVDMSLVLLLMNASLSITASRLARSGPGIYTNFH